MAATHAENTTRPSDGGATRLRRRPARPAVAPDSVQHVLVEVVMALEHIGAFDSFESEWQRSLLGISSGEGRQWATLLLFAFSGGTTSSEAIAKRLKADPVYRSLGGPRPASLEELRAFRAQHREALASIFSEILETLSACGMTRLRQCDLRTIAQAEGRPARLEASRRIGESLLDAEGDTGAATAGRTTSDALPDAMRDRASRHQRIAEVVTQRQAGETGQRWDELTQLIDLASIDGDLSDPLTRSARPSTGEFAELEQLFLEADLPLDDSGAENAEDHGLFGHVDDFTLGEVEYRGDVGASDAARLTPTQVPTSPGAPLRASGNEQTAPRAMRSEGAALSRSLRSAPTATRLA